MLNLTIMLRRLLTRQPDPRSISFAWWYVAGRGRAAWTKSMADAGCRKSKLRRLLRKQDVLMATRLETWDTVPYRMWKSGAGPAGDFSQLFPDLEFLEISHRQAGPCFCGLNIKEVR